MKGVLACLLILVLSFPCVIYGQETEEGFRPLVERKNEVKLGAIQLIGNSRINIEYERILDSYSSYGLNAVHDLESEEDWDLDNLINIRISPFFRMYFTKREDYGSNGFFAQVFASYTNGETYTSEYYSTYQNGYYYSSYLEKKESYNAFSGGFSLGKKWTNRKGFALQAVIGIGRKIAGSDVAPEFIAPGALSIGYRF